MTGQEPRQMGSNPDRSHPRTASAMRDAERLVQVEVTDVRAEVSRPAQSYLRIHVGAIHVNLAAVLMDDGAYLLDSLFENAVRGGIGHHQRGEIFVVALGFFPEVLQINVSSCVASHRND